jgi:hypothetical protein
MTMSKVIDEGTANITPTLKKKNALLVSVFKFIKPWFYITWTIYPVAYLMPGLIPLLGETNSFLGTVVVSQQVLYTIADVTSKVIYGIMLNTVSTFLSTEEGFQEAN